MVALDANGVSVALQPDGKTRWLNAPRVGASARRVEVPVDGQPGVVRCLRLLAGPLGCGDKGGQFGCFRRLGRPGLQHSGVAVVNQGLGYPATRSRRAPSRSPSQLLVIRRQN